MLLYSVWNKVEHTAVFQSGKRISFFDKIPYEDVDNNFFLFLNFLWDFWNELWDREVCFKTLGLVLG